MEYIHFIVPINMNATWPMTMESLKALLNETILIKINRLTGINVASAGHQRCCWRGCLANWIASRAAPMSKFLAWRRRVNQPPSSVNPIDSIWAKDSTRRGSASVAHGQTLAEAWHTNTPGLCPGAHLLAGGGIKPPPSDLLDFAVHLKVNPGSAGTAAPQ